MTGDDLQSILDAIERRRKIKLKEYGSGDLSKQFIQGFNTGITSAINAVYAVRSAEYESQNNVKQGIVRRPEDI